jgi:ElaB/YqjD/DUF883 family membrane-anchored ribosome-binding protein
MAEQAELIQQQMDETRSNLAEKLEKLGEQITGTVEKVSETVEETVEAVSDTVESVAETTQETVHAVKEAFNLPKQIQQRPWLWFGGSIALGFVGTKLFLTPARREDYGEERRDRHEHYDLKMPSSYDTAPPRSENVDLSGGFDASKLAQTADRPTSGWSATSTTSTGGTNGTHEGPQQEQTQESWLSKFTHTFGSEIETLKGLALGTVFGVIRDLVGRAVPAALKGDLTSVIDNMTKDAGGKPIQGTLLDLPEKQQGKSDQKDESDADEDENHSAEWRDQPGTQHQQQGGQKSGNWREQSGERSNRSRERQTQTTESKRRK